MLDAIAESIADRVIERLPDPRAPLPEEARTRLALSKEEAAAAIGCSVDHFERHVQPGLRLVRSGRLRMIPVGELEAWLDRNAATALEEVA